MRRIKIKVSTRLVILSKTKAFKIPLDRRGWLQGVNETKVWENHKKSGYLAPLLWSFGGFVCMRRVTPTNEVPLQLVATIKAAIPALDVANCDLCRLENWGEYMGAHVLLDYGIDERVSKMYPLNS